MTSRAYAQGGYQRATTELEGAIQRPVQLAKDPSGAGVLLRLSAGERVDIIGRQGKWFDVRVSPQRGSARGWIPSDSVQILGPKAAPAVIEAPPPTVVRRSESLARRVSNPYRLMPTIGLAYGAKNISTQIRGGVSLLYSIRSGVEIGGTAEVGFRHGTLISAGPSFAHALSWPRVGAIRTGVYGGFPFVYSKKSGVTQKYLGIRMGVELSAPLGGVDVVLTAGPEILLFGARAVSIPVIGAIGFSYRF